MMKFLQIMIVLLVILSGCRQQQEVTKRYYVIEIPAQINTEFKDTLPTINKHCEVSPVNVFPAFATHRIALRGSSHEIEYFRNHEWATRPAENLTTIIVDFFDRYEVFKGVDTRYWKTVPDYHLETTIYQMEIVENRKKLSARLNIEFRFIDQNTGEVILKHTSDKTRELEENKINLFAAEISEMFYEELINISFKLAITQH